MTKANGLLLETRRLSAEDSAIPEDDSSSSLNSLSEELKSSASTAGAFSKGATQMIPLTIGTTRGSVPSMAVAFFNLMSAGDRGAMLRPKPLSRCLREEDGDLRWVTLILNQT